MQHINQITKLRGADGREIGLVDWTWRPVYSSCFILDGATDQMIRLFTYAEGDTVAVTDNIPAASRPTATDFHTNVSEAAEMDSTEEILCYGIQVEVMEFTHSEPNITQSGVLNSGVPRVGVIGPLAVNFMLELEVSQKDYPKAGIGYFASGFGPVVAMNNIGAAATAANLGTQSREAVDQFPVPVHLGGTEKYSVNITNPNGAAVDFRGDDGNANNNATAFLRVYLVGLHKRPTG